MGTIDDNATTKQHLVVELSPHEHACAQEEAKDSGIGGEIATSQTVFCRHWRL
jgi:hypothetical protein